MLANIKKTFSPMPSILKQAQTGVQMKYPAVATALLSAVIAYAAMFGEILLMMPYMVVKGVLAGIAASETGRISLDLNGDEMLIAQLFVTVGATAVAMLYVRFGEKRSLRSMGFVKEHAVTDYLLGAVIGFAMFAACVGLCVVTGAMRYGGFVLGGRYGMLALLLVGFVIQGMSEETICRGFMMTSLGSKAGAVAGVLFNSVFFGVLHLNNAGVTLLSIVNIILFGIFMSVVALKLSSIWMVCAIHSVWNFVQGNFLGIRVSGIDAGPSVFRFESAESLHLLNGGSFGIEGGLAATAVLVVGIAVALLIRPRRAAEDDAA